MALISIVLWGCAPYQSSIQGPLSEWDELVGCPQSHRQKFFNPYYTWASQEQPPSEKELLDFLDSQTEKITADQKDRLLKIHQMLIDRIYSFDSVHERLEYLAQLDLGEASQDSTWFTGEWLELYGTSSDGAHCGAPTQPAPSTPDTKDSEHSYLLSGQPRAWWGAMKAFATSYQSCQALYQPALTDEDSSLAGLSYYGEHATGSSRLYTVASPERLKQTHPYLRSWEPAGSQCFQVPKNPLIYDYGGKPYVDPGAPNELNFFKNAGTGSPALGLDCSGFVFSALASVGLKLSTTMPLKANHVYGINSAMFKLPERNGLDCLKPIGLHSLRVFEPGDIVASSNHVFMVDRVGDDPLGVGDLEERECVISRMDYRRFDFDIVQSSASKNFIGIHRAKASDYLQRDPVMRKGLEDYALSLCKARFGTGRAPTRTLASVVRVSDSPSCRTYPVTLTHQSCVRGCFDLPEIFQKFY